MLATLMQARNITPMRALFAGILVLASTTALAAPVKIADSPFLIARDAFRVGDNGRLVKAREQLKGHVLEPYAEYWSLRMRLSEASADEVHGFFVRYPDSLLADQLRKDWLRALARQQRWDAFREEYPSVKMDEPELACLALQARWRLHDESALAELQPHWNAARDIPDGCAPLVEVLLRSGQLGPRQVLDRFRVLMHANQMTAAKRLLPWLPGEQSVEAKQIERVIRAPVKFLGKPGVDLKKAGARELVILALSRTARGDPLEAAGFWNAKLRAQFPAADQGYVWALLAEQGARRHMPESLEWYLAARDTPLSEEQAAWRARIALRQQSWAEVKYSIERMPSSMRAEATWTYWLGRAHAALGAKSEAEALYVRISGEHHFYGRLAAEELGHAFELPAKSPAPSADELSRVVAVPGLARALALYSVGMRTEATREWIWTIRGMDDRMLLAAAELARRNQIWDRAIGTADRTVAAHDFSVRYLAPYREILGEQARVQRLEEPWVYGLVRQESRFIAEAKSSVGASGLMQLMPATARWVARQLGIKGYSADKVTEPQTNAALGTFYLKHVLDDLQGSPVMAAAAYNAGPGRARKWRGPRALEGAIYAETIPFSETRDYVKKVMVNTLYYSAVFGGEVRSLKGRLGVVAPRGSGEVMALGDELPQLQ